ncbi:MAG: hypothetical protein WCS17_08055, partial [Prevotella sp.]
DTTIYLGLTAVVYTVSFDVGISDLIIPASQTIESGSCATDPNVVIDGFTVAWYSDLELTILFDYTSAITANTTLYLGLTAVSVDPSDPGDVSNSTDSDDLWYFNIEFLIVMVVLFAISYCYLLSRR